MLMLASRQLLCSFLHLFIAQICGVTVGLELIQDLMRKGRKNGMIFFVSLSSRVNTLIRTLCCLVTRALN